MYKPCDVLDHRRRTDPTKVIISTDILFTHLFFLY